METNNKKKPINGLPFYALTFLTALLFEFYWILNGPTDYFMLVGIGIIIIITGYLTIDSILKLHTDALATRQQQNDTIVKAQKAIYLATKKTAKETEKIRAQNMKTLEVLVAGMVSSQKELVKLISANGNALASTPAADSADMTELIGKLSQSNEMLAKQVQDAMTIDELVKSNAELVKSVQGIFTGAPAKATDSSSNETEEFPETYTDDLSETFNDELATNFVDELPGELSEDVSEEYEEDNVALDSDEGLVVDTLLDTIEDFSASDEDMLADNNISFDETIATEDITANVTEANEFPAASSVADQETTTESAERDPNAPLSEEEIAALFASL